jgi:hypothetical protein
MVIPRLLVGVFGFPVGSVATVFFGESGSLVRASITRVSIAAMIRPVDISKWPTTEPASIMIEGAVVDTGCTDGRDACAESGLGRPRYDVSSEGFRWCEEEYA